MKRIKLMIDGHVFYIDECDGRPEIWRYDQGRAEAGESCAAYIEAAGFDGRIRSMSLEIAVEFVP